jgi:hypothetical protein
MASALELFRNRALANATFSASITTGSVSRLYSETAPQAAALPFVQMHLMPQEHDRNMSGASGLVKAVVQFDIYATTMVGAHSIGDKLRLALDNIRNASVTIGADTHIIQSIAILRDNTGYVQPENGADVSIRRVSYDFNMFYEITPA